MVDTFRTAAELDYSIHYRNWHEESHEHVREMTDRLKRYIFDWIPLDLKGPVLDVGCGMGFTVLAFRELGFTDCRGIDTDTAQIEACRRLGVDAEKVSDSIVYLTSRPEQFQVITLLDVLEHVPVARQVDMMRAVHVALAPGGRVLVQVPNANSPLAARWRYIDYTHFCSFTEHSLQFVLRNAYFDEITIQGYEPIRRPSLRIWRSGVRRSWEASCWRWAWFLAWRKLMEGELGRESVDRMPLTLNMTGVAVKGPDCQR
jgi:2-polyprenyl-3-methyl-5-hydroxy-6-metoxy-1,4-benzoquinol methylase